MEILLDAHEVEVLASRFKILAEPTRLKILATLCYQERSVQEICDRTQLLQSNVSKHLRLMKSAGVVDCRQEGIWRYYRVIDTELLSLCAQTRQSLVNRSIKPLVK